MGTEALTEWRTRPPGSRQAPRGERGYWAPLAEPSLRSWEHSVVNMGSRLSANQARGEFYGETEAQSIDAHAAAAEGSHQAGLAPASVSAPPPRWSVLLCSGRVQGQPPTTRLGPRESTGSVPFKGQERDSHLQTWQSYDSNQGRTDKWGGLTLSSSPPGARRAVRPCRGVESVITKPSN